MDAALEAWRAAGIETCDGVVGDPIPLEALGEVWDPMRHDEVIVSHAAGPELEVDPLRPPARGRAPRASR